MQETINSSVATPENQLAKCFGPLTSRTQLVEPICRSTGGLRYGLSYSSDSSTRASKAYGRKISGRVYCPASEVARIIVGTDEV